MGVNFFEPSPDNPRLGWTYVTPRSLRRAAICERRILYDVDALPHSVQREADLRPATRSVGEVFHEDLSRMAVQRPGRNGLRRHHEYGMTGIIDGIYLIGTADFMNTSSGQPITVDEYKNRPNRTIWPSDKIQAESYGFMLGSEPDAMDISGLMVRIVVASSGCSSCPKALHVPFEPGEYACNGSECDGKESLVANIDIFELLETRKRIRDALDFFEGKREPRSSRSREVCNRCDYKRDCPTNLTKTGQSDEAL